MDSVLQVRTWFTIRVYRPSANTSRAVHLSPADSISFLAKHHRRVVASKAYEHLWLAFYYRFQKPGSESTAPNASVIESSAKMQSFVLNQVIEAKIKGKSGPACFPVSGLGRYTANISSVEWVAEINSAIPRTQVLASDNVSVSDLSVIRAIDAIFRSYSRPEIMDYMGWQLAQLYGPLVDPELSKEYFGDHERAAIYLPHVCAKQVEISYSGLPSALYYSTRLDEPARSAVRTTLESVVNTTAVLIERVPWLDVGTKSAAAAKIRSAKVNLWPPSWILEKEVLTRVYSRFPVNATSLTDFLTQSTNAMVELLESETDFAEVLSSPLSGSMPYFSYDRALNEVSISAGAVQFPLFVPGGTTSMNYGGLGFSFALQLVRSLDSASRTVAAQGRCSSGDDGTFSSLTAALRQRSSCLARVYNGSFFPEVAALEAVHAAYVDSGAHHNGRRIVDVFTNEQVFFIALCYFNCGRPRGRRDFYTSCNKAVLHYPPFAKAFGCSLRSLMNPSGNCGFF
ncbi:hypothetical protein HPB50_008679 [Hyalomma asiaticum]|uniref:Uncharacterized protein n=1 Tax=Hyalomma asiaticum TaxID=266040 RepID=A0ACB7RHW4_HYAAI|nr:hypothetical protein HPB50_008679 [Hyalomma asiaticum]